MRRKDRAITVEEARSLLETAEYGVLSMASAGGEPHGVPVNFVLVGDGIYFHCAPEGRKIELLAGNARVSFCVVGRTRVQPEEFGTLYESAIATGAVEELDGDEKRRGLMHLVEKYSPGFIEEGIAYIDRLVDRTTVYRIRLDSITGKARR